MSAKIRGFLEECSKRCSIVERTLSVSKALKPARYNRKVQPGECQTQNSKLKIESADGEESADYLADSTHTPSKLTTWLEAELL